MKGIKVRITNTQALDCLSVCDSNLKMINGITDQRDRLKIVNYCQHARQKRKSYVSGVCFTVQWQSLRKFLHPRLR